MISPNSIRYDVTSDDRFLKARASLHVVLEKTYSSHQEFDRDYEERKAKAILWNSLFGDLSRDLFHLEKLFLMSSEVRWSDKGLQISETLRSLQDRVKNPFLS